MSCGCGGGTRGGPRHDPREDQAGNQTADHQADSGGWAADWAWTHDLAHAWAWADSQFVTPGEVKNPGGTERLKRYWTEGPGAAKIGWGRPCDFCGCLRQLRKYVPRRMLKGLCANLHHRALGMWPGQHTIDKNKAHGCPC